MPTQKPSNVTLRLADALSNSSALSSLLVRVQESRARLDAVRSDLPQGLADLVRPGPLDETGWTLLVSSGAAAAKLRQCVPRLQQALADKGWGALGIRVKVQGAPR
ncbi:MAG: hypothetical protein OEU93_11465 [Rubrivivax sp.]|nr:hypothetical protein [Rubrivivax sp.]MDH5339985.1 hypothetical protein [Rubrivivax sp.]